MKKLSKNVHSKNTDFHEQAFIIYCLAKPWLDLSLKERMKKISCALYKYIPGDFAYKAKLLSEISSEFHGYVACVFPDFISEYGLNHYEVSIYCMENMTTYSTAEFAVRPFLEKYPDQMLSQMLLWSQHHNEHVRRLSSEACRPRLPWGKALTQFKKDPRPLFEILDILKNDSSEYVRRSVANNLNDIGKDHPQLLKDYVSRNYGQISINCDKMLKHASRNLLKSGDEEILNIFSYPKADHVQINNFNLNKNVKWGGDLSFNFQLSSPDQDLGLLRLEYQIDHLKMNGAYHSKVFKISETLIKTKLKVVNRKHSFKKISVRKYYPGEHRVSIKLNGKIVLTESFDLLPDI